MSIAILGKKVGMTHFFDEEGNRVSATVVEAGPCQVMRVKTAEGRDGYDAVVLGLGRAKEKHLAKAQIGEAKKLGIEPPIVVREVRVTQDEALLYPDGGEVDVSLFQAGERVDVVANSRGRGFAGVMKRYNFAGTSRSHGTHEVFRHGGSIGMCQFPGRVLKGKRMAGHMGNVRKTVLNQRVVAIFPDRNLILIEGNVPGAPNGLVMIRKTVRIKKYKVGNEAA